MGARDRRTQVEPEVFPWNEPAIALYRKFGFVEEGRLRKQYRRQNGELWDVLVMGLVLDES
jgi:RimJ/RimL family protein N-acetyltransferase